MTPRVDEAVRLRDCRAAFERALADGVDVPEARRRLAFERWGDADRRLADKRCGTRSQMPADQDDGDAGLFWWQR